MTVLISSRFAGATEMRFADGRYEAVLPEPTAIESAMQDGIFDRDLGRVEKRIAAAKPRVSRAARVRRALRRLIPQRVTRRA